MHQAAEVLTEDQQRREWLVGKKALVISLCL